MPVIDKRNALAFWDTSAITPLCVRQSFTSQVRQLSRTYPQIVVWWGTSIEARSSFARLLREKVIKQKDFQQALRHLEMLRHKQIEVVPSERLREIAEELPDQYGLRSLDALQLASALIRCKEKPHKRPFICFDIRLAEAAQKAGFTVYPE